jgi:hypothetical protein
LYISFYINHFNEILILRPYARFSQCEIPSMANATPVRRHLFNKEMREGTRGSGFGPCIPQKEGAGVLQIADSWDSGMCEGIGS